MWDGGSQFDEVDEFIEGLVRVEKDDKYGYIDKNGKVVIEPQFGEVGDFSEGFACVATES